MIRHKHTLFLSLGLLFLLLGISSCRKAKPTGYDTLASSGLTERTENLRQNLYPYEERGIMIGQQYATIEGIGWMGDSARADLFEVSDDWPAVVGGELRGIEQGVEVNADSIPFALLRDGLVAYLQKQGLVTLTWTTPNPGANPTDENSEGGKQLRQWTKRVADYLASLQNGYGIKVPVVLTLYPRYAGGQKQWYDDLSADDYKKLYAETAQWLRDDTLTNAVLAYQSCEAFTTAEAYWQYCPEELADVLQYGAYATTAQYEGFGQRLQKATQAISTLATEKMKPFGLTVAAQALGSDSTFFTRNLEPIVGQCRMSYILLGRNHGEPKDMRFGGPFPGNAATNDFMKLYNHERTLMMSKVNGLLLKKE